MISFHKANLVTGRKQGATAVCNVEIVILMNHVMKSHIMNVEMSTETPNNIGKSVKSSD